jgi:PHD/YefM family antitoxin component YafN of YafNO toxin-antitoxin module
MSEILNKFSPRYIVDEKGVKTAVVIDFSDYNKMMEFIEDLEDATDLLKAELEAIEFTPYEEFRNRWLNA